LTVQYIAKYNEKNRKYDVTFIVNRGKYFGSLGPNNTGKITFIAMTAGLLLLTHEKIVYKWI